MRALVVHCGFLAAILTSLLTFSEATVGGQYSVSVHFVAPLVNAPCQVAQFWTPPNVICGLCFCMTGTLSRCIPQPGCNPQNATTTMSPPTSNSTDQGKPPPEEGSSQPDNGGQEALPEGEKPSDQKPPPPQEQPSEGNPPAEEAKPQDPAPPPEAPPNPPEEANGTPSKVNKLRGAKPGKSRRRRHIRRQ